MRTFLENPIIVIVLIWIISAFFKQAKENNADAEKKRKVPKWTSMRPEKNTGQHRVELERASGAKRRENKTGRNDLRRSEPRNQPTQEEMSLASFAHGLTQGEQEAYSNAKELENSAEQRKLDIDAKRLVDGLIWSEILGPPRAKRPHKVIKKS